MSVEVEQNSSGDHTRNSEAMTDLHKLPPWTGMKRRTEAASDASSMVGKITREYKSNKQATSRKHDKSLKTKEQVA